MFRRGGPTLVWGGRVDVKLLLDENLSPRVAETLCREDAIDACHVRDRGLLEATDHEVLERAYAEDRVVVTCNVGDFVKLARARDLHPGIVLLEDGGLVRAEQLIVIRRAVAALRLERDLLNRVIRIWLEGDVVFEARPRDSMRERTAGGGGTLRRPSVHDVPPRPRTAPRDRWTGLHATTLQSRGAGPSSFAATTPR
ncbi:MAG: DUF5615 family PIN-like protein [Polyangiaceae bacterium]